MNTITRLSAPLLPLLLTACAATAPPISGRAGRFAARQIHQNPHARR